MLFIVNNEGNRELFFSSLQSDFANKFLEEFAIASKDSKTLYLYSEGKIFSKSRAFFSLIPFLKWYCYFFYLGYLFPQLIADFFYDIVASRRKKFFPKNCDISKLGRNRILD